MNSKRRKHLDTFQNIAIVLLAVSAVFLFAQTQLYNLGVDLGSSYFLRLAGNPTQNEGASSSDLSDFSAPVRVAVSGTYGCYANVTLTTSDEEFLPLVSLLHEVLGSAHSRRDCSEQDFLLALNGTSVYFDFLTALPMSAIADLVEADWHDPLSARRLIIAEQNNAVQLYLWDNKTQFISFSSAVSTEDLNETISNYELAGNSFAFLEADSDNHYQNLAPYTLLLSELPSLPVLSSAEFISSPNDLLEALEFNPNTKSRYIEASGTEVVVDGDRSLRIRPDKSVLYQSGGAAVLSVDAAGNLPTLEEAVAGAVPLVNSLLPAGSEDIALYLTGIRQFGDTTTLTFDYQVRGVPIRLSSGNAAEVTLSGTAVSSLSLRFRQYTVTGNNSLLLPLQQAAAIAAQRPGFELTIGYTDNGGNTIGANWLAD